MLGILQTLGMMYIALMLYLTFLYYKKNNFSARSFSFWVVVWAFGAILLLFPQSASDLTEKLTVARVIDFYLILGLMFFSIICFINFATVRRTEQKVEDLVRQIALQKKRK